MELKKIKLNKLSNNTLSERQMRGLKGGESCCRCGCYYADHGGSSTTDNGKANAEHCYESVRQLDEVVVIGKRKR